MTPEERIPARFDHDYDAPSDKDRISILEAEVRALTNALAFALNRIAKAPRAWAVRYGKGPIVPGDCFQRKEDADRRARAFDVRVVPVALVELKPEEA